MRRAAAPPVLRTGNKKSRIARYLEIDSSATRLSHGDPVGFPSHPRGWFSSIAIETVKLYGPTLTHGNSPVKVGMPKECYNHVKLFCFWYTIFDFYPQGAIVRGSLTWQFRNISVR
jgi:hypothetical protein